jgi:hypothetical protein
VIDPHHTWLLHQITERFLAAEAVKAVSGNWLAAARYLTDTLGRCSG